MALMPLMAFQTVWDLQAGSMSAGSRFSLLILEHLQQQAFAILGDMDTECA